LHSCTHTILHLRWYQGQRNFQAITDILQANQQHLELLRLDISDYDGRDLVFLPPNLKYLSTSCSEGNGDELMSELAARQCPNLCGVELYNPITVRTINTISRFQKFVVYLIIWMNIYKIIILFQSYISCDSFWWKSWRWLPWKRAQYHDSFWRHPPSSEPGYLWPKKFQGFIYYY